MNKKSKSGSSQKKKAIKKEITLPSKAALIRKYYRVMKEIPPNTQRLHELAIMLSHRYLDDFSIKVYKKLIKHEPKNALHYCDLSDRYFSKANELEFLNLLKLSIKNYSQAVKVLKKAKSILPKEPYINLYLSFAYAGINDFEKCSKFLLRARREIKGVKENMKKLYLYKTLNFFSRIVFSRFYRINGLIKLKKNKFQDALIDFKSALAFNKLDIPSYYWMAYTYFSLNQTKNTIDILKECSNLRPDLPFPYYLRGLFHAWIYDFAKAASLFDEYLNRCKFWKVNDSSLKISKTLYYFCIAMFNWLNDLDKEASKYFKKTSKLNKQIKKESPEIQFIPLLILVDDRLFRLGYSYNLLHFRSNLNSITNYLSKIISSIGKKEYFQNISIRTLINLVETKRIIVFNLQSLFSPIPQMYKDKMSINNIIEIKAGDYGFDFVKTIFDTYNFHCGFQGLEGVRNFIKEVRSYPNIYKIPISKQRRLIEKLRPHLITLSKPASVIFYNISINATTNKFKDNIDAYYNEWMLKKLQAYLLEMSEGIPTRLSLKFKKLIRNIIIKEEKILKIAFNKRPFIKIGSKDFDIDERLFAYLCRIAVGNEKKQSINRSKDLWLHQKAQDISDLRDELKKIINLLFEEKIKTIIDKRLKIMFFENIEIDESIKQFESEHREAIESKVSIIYNTWKDKEKETGRIIGIGKILKELDYDKTKFQNVRAMMRATHLVRKSSEIKFGQFHDDEWIKNWYSFMKKIRDVFYDIKYEELDKEIKDLRIKYTGLINDDNYII